MSDICNASQEATYQILGTYYGSGKLSSCKIYEEVFAEKFREIIDSEGLGITKAAVSEFLLDNADALLDEGVEEVFGKTNVLAYKLTAKTCAFIIDKAFSDLDFKETWDYINHVMPLINIQNTAETQCKNYIPTGKWQLAKYSAMMYLNLFLVDSAFKADIILAKAQVQSALDTYAALAAVDDKDLEQINNDPIKLEELLIRQTEKGIVEIEINSLPKRTSYAKDSLIFTSGMSLKLHYKDGTEGIENLEHSNFQLNPEYSNGEANQTITLTYNDLDVSFNINDGTQSLEEFELPPNKQFVIIIIHLQRLSPDTFVVALKQCLKQIGLLIYFNKILRPVCLQIRCGFTSENSSTAGTGFYGHCRHAAGTADHENRAVNKNRREHFADVHSQLWQPDAKHFPDCVETELPELEPKSRTFAEKVVQ